MNRTAAKLFIGWFVCVALAALALVSAVIYVAAHFIGKFW